MEACGKAPADFNRASCWKPNLQKFGMMSTAIVDRNKNASYWEILFLWKWALRSNQFAERQKKKIKNKKEKKKC